MKIILFFFICILIFLIFFIPLYNTFEESTHQMMNETKEWFENFLNECHNELYLTMDDLQKCLKTHNIPYIITCGTLLGAVRSKSIIPHDDDIDIGILDKYKEKLWTKEFKQELKKYDMVIYKTIQGIIKIQRKTNKCDIFIDIFILKSKNNQYLYESSYCSWKWENEYYYDDELFPLKEYDFGPIKVTGPQNPIPFLERSYGSDWNIPKTSHTHAYYILNNKKDLSLKQKCQIYLHLLLVYNLKKKI